MKCKLFDIIPDTKVGTERHTCRNWAFGNENSENFVPFHLFCESKSMTQRVCITDKTVSRLQRSTLLALGVALFSLSHTFLEALQPSS